MGSVVEVGGGGRKVCGGGGSGLVMGGGCMVWFIGEVRIYWRGMGSRWCDGRRVSGGRRVHDRRRVRDVKGNLGGQE